MTENNNHSDPSNENIDIAIIGAGIAGLSAAVFARKAGYSVRVFEQHTIPGGLCTSWRRKGFLFDYCIDWFMGSRKNQGFYRLWEELGVIDKTDFLPIDALGIYKDSNGDSVILYTDHRKLKEHLMQIAPEDSKMIKQFCRAVSRIGTFLLTRLSFKPADIPLVLRSLSSLLVISRWSKITAEQWFGKFKNPLLREGLKTIIGGKTPLGGPILVIGQMANGGIGHLTGGSQSLADTMQDYAKSLGAHFYYGKKTVQILEKNGRAYGLRFDDGTIQKARYVIAACDVRSVLNKLVSKPISNPDYNAMFEKKQLYSGIVQISLGVTIDPRWNLEQTPYSMHLPLNRPLIMEEQEIRRVAVRHYAKDPSMAPEGSTVMVLRLESRYRFWEKLSASPEAYRREKERLLNDTAASLEQHFEGITERIVAADVATPITCNRYTGNWEGSTQGWFLDKEQMKRQMKGKYLPNTFPELPGLYLAGQWTIPGGGLPPSAQSGKDVIQLIKKTER